MKKTWLELSCTVPESLLDLISEFLVNISGNGIITENLSVDTFSVDDIFHPPEITVKAYFDAGTPADKLSSQVLTFLKEKEPQFPGLKVQSPVISIIREEDWANNWKEYFKPSRIGQSIVIQPSWENYAAADSDLIIEIDPGQAFGTGTHATTRLCLESLEKIYYAQVPFDTSIHKKPAAVLDVGTGSGVLSIAAAKLGARKIRAVDIDPEAVEVARDNLANNEITGDVVVSATAVDAIEGTYEVVLANIIAEELVKLSPQLVSKVAVEGFLILSGILSDREQYVLEGFSIFPIDLLEISRREEWSCLTYRRKSK